MSAKLMRMDKVTIKDSYILLITMMVRAPVLIYKIINGYNLMRNKNMFIIEMIGKLNIMQGEEEMEGLHKNRSRKFLKKFLPL